MSYSIKRGRLSRRRTFSVFDDMEWVSVTPISAPASPLPTVPWVGMQVECVYYEGKDPEKATPIAIYVVLEWRA